MTRIGDAYRWAHGRVSDKPTNFGWVVQGKLAGSGLPVTHSEFKWVIGQGIRSIVTVREVPLPKGWFDDGIGYLHLEVEDFGAPSIDEIQNAVSYIKEQIADSRPVLVHCAAGKGRTGVILASYLVNVEGISSENAIEKLRLMRPGSVQSEVQEMAVAMYEKFLKSNGA